MKKILYMIPYLLVSVAAFYLLPIVVKSTGAAMIVMLAAIPLICFAAAIVYGATRQGALLLYSALVACLFVPSIFVFYNYTAWPYILIYGAVSGVGGLVGRQFYNAKNK